MSVKLKKGLHLAQAVAEEGSKVQLSQFYTHEYWIRTKLAK